MIKDLAKPDNLITIGSFSINVLPVLMTLINIISGAIYTKGFSLKDKLQLYVMALFFLVFLYNSPSGLVFYWTMNNVFSLIKNLFYKAKNPKKTFFYFCCVVIFLLQIFLLKNIITKFTITHSIPKYRVFILLVTVAFYFLPIIIKLINNSTIYIYIGLNYKNNY